MAALDRVADREPSRRGKAPLSTFAELAAALAGGVGLQETLATLTSACVAVIPGADAAKISVVDGGRLKSIAATPSRTGSLDDAQQAARCGPCLDAVSRRKTIRCNDLRSDTRWPQFARHATTVGVHAILSFPVDVGGGAAATLTLFGFRADAFGADSETAGAMLATYASIALLMEAQERQFRAALATRDIIGQAKGMLMERYGVDASRASAMLTAVSQDTDVPVRELAASFVESFRR